MKTVTVLLVEDRPGDARLVEEALQSAGDTVFRIRRVSRLGQARRILAHEPFDIVLLDLGLPDSQGLETFALLHAGDPFVPVIVLSGLDDEPTAIEAVRLGAQDYIVKGTYPPGWLERAIRYAIERHRLLDQLTRTLAYARRPPGETALSREEEVVSMCAWCKRVRDEEGRWATIEQFLADRTHALLTHGMCPKCADELPIDSPGGSRS